MPRSKVGRGDAEAIAQRLKDFVEGRYKKWEEFRKASGVPRTTADAWRSASPSVPDPLFLLLLARKENLNLNWLLLGEGPQLRIEESSEPNDQVEATMKAELRQSEKDCAPEEFEAAWSRLKMFGDYTRMEKDGAVLRLAVQGVRLRFQEELRNVRAGVGFTRLLNTLPALLDDSGQVKKAETVRKLFSDAGIPLMRMEMHQISVSEAQPVIAPDQEAL
jgi:hypothetical protein